MFNLKKTGTQRSSESKSRCSLPLRILSLLVGICGALTGYFLSAHSAIAGMLENGLNRIGTTTLI